MKRLIGLLAVAALLTVPVAAHADTTLTPGTSSPRGYHSAARLYTTDKSGIHEISVYYSWDHYIHRQALPVGNTVSVWESFTCHNDGACRDFISATGVGDNPGTQNQGHESIHHNSDITFHPTGVGHTVVDEHYEHGGITRLAVAFNDGREIYVNFAEGLNTPSGEYTAPHLDELYVNTTTGHESVGFVSDLS
jgi:hypothetical protein